MRKILKCHLTTTRSVELYGLSCVDGESPFERVVLVRCQKNPGENGIYKASPTAWERAAVQLNEETVVLVSAGVSLPKTFWAMLSSNDAPVLLGTSHDHAMTSLEILLGKDPTCTD